MCEGHRMVVFHGKTTSSLNGPRACLRRRHAHLLGKLHTSSSMTLPTTDLLTSTHAHACVHMRVRAHTHTHTHTRAHTPKHAHKLLHQTPTHAPINLHQPCAKQAHSREAQPLDALPPWRRRLMLLRILLHVHIELLWVHLLQRGRGLRLQPQRLQCVFVRVCVGERACMCVCDHVCACMLK